MRSESQPAAPFRKMLPASAKPSMTPTKNGEAPRAPVSSRGKARATISLEQSLKKETQPSRVAMLTCEGRRGMELV
jgi:hypothetical protein